MMFKKLEEISQRPEVFGAYTARSLWADRHRAKQMLAYHLDDALDVSSRNHEFIRNSVRWIGQEFSVRPGFRICDFGCGPGLYASRLAELGATVTGIDFSANSIEYARKHAAEQGLDIEYVHADYLDFEPAGHYDLITLIMCDFCALGPAQRRSLLGKFAGLMAPGAKLLMDVYSMVSFENKEEAAGYEKNQLNHFWYEEDYYGFCNSFKYDRESVILDKYTLFPESGGHEVVYNWLQCYDVESLKAEIERAGMRVKAVYSDVCGNAFDPGLPEFAVVVEKSG